MADSVHTLNWGSRLKLLLPKLLLALLAIVFISAPMPFPKIDPQGEPTPDATSSTTDDNHPPVIEHDAGDLAPDGHPHPAEDPLEPLHRSEIRASIVFMGFSLWKLLACVFCGLCGRKVKISLVLLTLGIGGFVAIIGLAVGWSFLILVGGFASIFGHTVHHAQTAVKVDEGPALEDDPSLLARFRRWAKRVITATGGWMKRVWAAFTSLWGKK